MRNIRCICLLAGIFQLNFLAVACADPLFNWTTNQVPTNSFALKHIVYGNGCYVAVGDQGDAGVVYSSANGTDWTLRYTDLNSWGLSLAYSDGQFVGAGGWETAVSADGTNWTVSFLPAQYQLDADAVPVDMTSGKGLYVETGDGSGNLITSTDGVTWTPRTSSPAPTGHIASVTYGALKFVAVGNNDGSVYVSARGTTWTRGSIAGGNKISFGNGLFFVPLAAGTNLISTDGVNWSQWATGLTNKLGKIIYSHGLYLAASGKHLTTSTDGTNWVQYPQIFPNSDRLTNYDNTFSTDGSYLAVVDYTPHIATETFTSQIFTSGPLVSVQLTNSPPSGIALSGLIGRNYQIQSVTNLAVSQNSWSTNVTVQLPQTPYIWTDTTATNSARFYRGVLLP
jgi:hypothetical protein